ncbi:acetyl-CoA carboxylase carboxyltransferase subunit alpha [Romboutsia maritimum]|uniref:Acetyl-coenzyme A carboxylase carboxyl transferase subunit alpha n=1 Tax=Romboutsia maritimum TaxID=2020948 RepID=A0A371ISR3_9FIRM|nr:acetyl-CoA carboxylase carboxyltransferase subunit alpha [Romboutsia maritimum]RDY23524.1 acetyl-CoA carboxylase carboxyltransferase subunit alpha [Romboutsia maritimum]
MYSEIKEKASAWDKVNIARDKNRPNSKFYIDNIFEDFLELHGDRTFKDDQAIIGGIGRLEEINLTIIGINKGSNTNENIKRNFGMPHPEGYTKALRLMKQAEKFKRPIICFVDTPGAFCGLEAEERGQGQAISKNLFEMSKLKTPIITIFIGEGGSGGALALAVSDKIYMLENSIYSVLSPEGFSSILWKDSTRVKEAAEVMKITAVDLKNFGIIDNIIQEPQGGAHKEPYLMAKKIKDVIKDEIYKLIEFDENQLINNRYDKFRNMGNFGY